jgi:hypothetical protein
MTEGVTLLVKDENLSDFLTACKAGMSLHEGRQRAIGQLSVVRGPLWEKQRAWGMWRDERDGRDGGRELEVGGGIQCSGFSVQVSGSTLYFSFS